jgi:membrane peptidoglycan carboxypeptidase
MAQIIGLKQIANTAKAMGYHNSPEGQEDIFSSNSFNPPMVIGTVQASPLTMANVYATIAANGVECTPIALKKVVDKDGKQLKVPSANCHQAIDSGIAQTVAYAMNQGVVQSDGEAKTTQLDGGRKTFAKTGTNEDTYMLTGGFVPSVAAYVAVGNAESQVSFNNKTINGVYHSTWYGAYIATPAWKTFMNSYLADTNTPIDNNYGNADAKYTGAATTSSSSSSSSSSSTTGQ